MEEKDKKGFLILMAMLSEAFNEQMSTERAKIYFEFLEKYQIHRVSYAIKKSVEKLKFFPKVSEIIEIIKGEYGSYPDIGDKKRIEFENKRDNEEALEWIKHIAATMGKKPKDIKQQISYKDE